MKKTALSAALLCLAQSSLHADVPLFINYQGKVADSSGLPIGASGTVTAPVAAPVNRKVIFRVYDAATGGNRLWTEEQTATISLGVFSVLLGNGINPTGTAAGESHATLDTVFTPSTTSRFLEITVDNGDNAITAADVPVSPRQQVTSTAFALHAKVADGIASATDLAINPVTGTASNYGLGWYGTGRTFNSIAVDGPVLYGNAGGALGSNVSGTKSLALLWNAAGQVGIGATASFANTNKLTLQGDDATTPAQQLVIRSNTDTTKRLNIGFDTTLNQATLQAYTAAAVSGNLQLNPSGGNVGIGSATAPAAKLSIGSPITGSASTLSTSFVTNAGALGTVLNSELLLGNFGFTAGNSESLAISAYRTAAGTTSSDTALLLGMNVDTTPRKGAFLSLHSNGNVGIGQSAPEFPLSLANTLGEKISLYGSSGTSFGFGIQSELLQIHTPTSTGDVAFGYGTSVAMTETMRIGGDGNVGIGTSSPGSKLSISDGGTDNTRYGSLQITRAATSHTAAHLAFVRTGQTMIGLGYKQSSSLFGFGPGTTGSFNPTFLSIDTDGTTGIGTTTTTGKLNVGSKLASWASIGKLTTDGAFNTNETRNEQLSIVAAGAMLATLYTISSDVRIKTDIHPTDGAEDLKSLLGIQITNYRHIDTVVNGNSSKKKVIAQQVESVYPIAVSKNRGEIPDIYRNAPFRDGWVEMVSNLKVGERVKLIGPSGESVTEVLEVKDGGFRTAFQPGGDKVFVYGREVLDFRSVDYDAIAMLNVSATQQIKREKDAEIQRLDRQLKEKDAKIATLEAKVAAQDKRSTAQADEDASQNARLIALEKLLNKAGASETVSIGLGGQ